MLFLWSYKNKKNPKGYLPARPFIVLVCKSVRLFFFPHIYPKLLALLHIFFPLQNIIYELSICTVSAVKLIPKGGGGRGKKPQTHYVAVSCVYVIALTVNTLFSCYLLIKMCQE